MRDAEVSFVGRCWALDAIDRWLGGSEPAMLVTGKPGSGKSALARHVRAISDGAVTDGARPRLRRGALLYAHFCRARDASVLDPVRFVERLSERLAGRFDGYRAALLESGEAAVTIHGEATAGAVEAGGEVTGVRVAVHVGERSAALAFERYVRAPLAALERELDFDVVVLVDALDESLSLAAGENIAGVLGDLLQAGSCPARLRFLLTSRPDRRVTAPLAGAPALDLVSDAPPGADDILAYAELRLADADVAEAVADASDGVFLYARYALDEVERSGTPGALPPGLDGHYRRFIERELAGREERWEERLRPVLGLLSVARGDGVPRPILAGVTGLARSAIDDALRLLEQFLEPAVDDPPRLYHESFREFLRDDDRYGVYPEEATRALIEWFAVQVEGGAAWPDFPYACANLAAHAADVGALDSLIWCRGFLAYAEPYGMRTALRASGSGVATLYEAAFHHLAERSPEQRALALRIVCERLGDRELARRLAALPETDAHVSWSATDAEVGAWWYRPSLTVHGVAVAEIADELTLALAVDRENGVRLWRPERSDLVVDVEKDWGAQLRFVGDSLVVSGHKTVVADGTTGAVTHRAWSPGPSAVVVEGGEPWLAEAHPVAGPVWVRSMTAEDLWKPVGGSLKPTAQQAAARTIATMQRRARAVVTIVPDPWILAIVDEDGGVLIAVRSQGLHVARLRVDGRALLPVAGALPPDAALLVAITEECGLRVLDARSARPVAGLDPERLLAGLPYGERPEEVQLLVAADGPVAYAATRGGHVVRWDVSADRVDRATIPEHSRLRVARHRDAPIVVAGCEDGLRVWREQAFFSQLAAERGPVRLIASGGGITAWIAPAPSGARLWAADAETGEILAGRQILATRPEALMVGSVDDQPVLAVVPDAHRATAEAYWLEDPRRDAEFDLGEGRPAALSGFRCAACGVGQDDSNHLQVADLVAAALGAAPVEDVHLLAVDPELRVALRLEIGGDFHLHDLGTGRQAPLPLGELPDMEVVGTSAVALVDGEVVAVATVRNLGTGMRSLWTARHGEPWRRLAESRCYDGFVAVGGAARGALIAFGNEFEVRVFVERDDRPPVVIPQPATALCFDPAGGLVLGTARGPIRLALD